MGPWAVCRGGCFQNLPTSDHRCALFPLLQADLGLAADHHALVDGSPRAGWTRGLADRGRHRQPERQDHGKRRNSGSGRGKEARRTQTPHRHPHTHFLAMVELSSTRPTCRTVTGHPACWLRSATAGPWLVPASSRTAAMQAAAQGPRSGRIAADDPDSPGRSGQGQGLRGDPASMVERTFAGSP